ncbi:LacI family DNA-binding transcriptional regulator [Streptomyces sp. NPDC059679]|uniref:LacI family DNA-binding transcriptional regulator n=1 Tax=Streptomyces sp. NPDC059679 TaxID=3346903 RepID=UPI00367DC3E6
MTRRRNSAGPTLATVERAARVSVPTVSKVVNGREDVAPDTRRRVTEALSRLGYARRPRAVAAGTHISQVDMMLTCLDGPRSGAVLRGAEIAADEAGYDLVVSAALARSSGAGFDDRWLHRLAGRGSSGALFDLAGLAASRSQCLERQNIPFVMVDPLLDALRHVSTHSPQGSRSSPNSSFESPARARRCFL